jgi:hypothetical protein
MWLAQQVDPARLPPSRTLRLVAGGLLAVGLLLGLLGFTRSATVSAPVGTDYKQRVVFRYDAPATPGLVYPTGQVHDGDPLFTQLIRMVRVTAAYSFVASSPPRVAGTIALSAMLRDSSGWHQTVPLASQQAFTGNHTIISAELDPHALLAVTDRVNTLTGVEGTPTVAVTAHVVTRGSLNGRPVTGDISPQRTFALSRTQLTPQGQASTTTKGSLSGTGSKPAHVKLLVVSLGVSTVRILAVLLLLLGLAAGALAAAARRSESEESPAEQLLDEHRALIVSGDTDLPVGLPVTEMENMAGLVQLAKRYERLILHEEKGGEHIFTLDDAGSVYRYRMPADDAPNWTRPDPAGNGEVPTQSTPQGLSNDFW